MSWADLKEKIEEVGGTVTAKADELQQIHDKLTAFGSDLYGPQLTQRMGLILDDIGGKVKMLRRVSMLLDAAMLGELPPDEFSAPTPMRPFKVTLEDGAQRVYMALDEESAANVAIYLTKKQPIKVEPTGDGTERRLPLARWPYEVEFVDGWKFETTAVDEDVARAEAEAACPGKQVRRVWIHKNGRARVAAEWDYRDIEQIKQEQIKQERIAQEEIQQSKVTPAMVRDEPKPKAREFHTTTPKQVHQPAPAPGEIRVRSDGRYVGCVDVTVNGKIVRKYFYNTSEEKVRTALSRVVDGTAQRRDPQTGTRILSVLAARGPLRPMDMAMILSTERHKIDCALSRLKDNGEVEADAAHVYRLVGPNPAAAASQPAPEPKPADVTVGESLREQILHTLFVNDAMDITELANTCDIAEELTRDVVKVLVREGLVEACDPAQGECWGLTDAEMMRRKQANEQRQSKAPRPTNNIADRIRSQIGGVDRTPQGLLRGSLVDRVFNFLCLQTEPVSPSTIYSKLPTDTMAAAMEALRVLQSKKLVQQVNADKNTWQVLSERAAANGGNQNEVHTSS